MDKAFGGILGGLVLLMLLFPTLMKSMADGSINVNGLILNFAETLYESFTRTPADWNPPTTEQPTNNEPRL